MIIADKLRSSGAVERLNGVITCIDNKAATQEELKLIKALKSDTVVLAGRTISVYAHAALDILGAEKYKGENVDVIDFISALKISSIDRLLG